MIYVQYVNKRNGTLDQKYITNIPLIECDAIGISSAVVNFFETKNVSLSKVVMLTTDGAAVMLGCNNGVHIHLKKYAPHLIEYHCIAHREVLAVSQAYKSINFFVRLESILRALYGYFSHSSVRMEKLKAVFHVLDKKFVRLQRLYDIRWLSRLQAVKAVVTTYETLIVYFENESNKDATADGLAKQLKSYRFALTIHFLYDILSTLFQTMGYHASKAHGKVDEVIRALSGRYLQGALDGDHMQHSVLQRFKVVS